MILHQMVFKFSLHGDFTSSLLILKELTNLKRIIRKILVNDGVHLTRKKMISIPLMMEKPVKSPIVPPIRLS